MWKTLFGGFTTLLFGVVLALYIISSFVALDSGDKDTEPSHLCDAELDDETIGKAPSSPLFIQEREEPADRRQAYHSYEESLLPAQSFFTHTQELGDPYTNLVRVNENQVAKWKTKESGFSLKVKKIANPI